MAFAADNCRTKVRRLIGKSTLTTFAQFRTEGQTIYRTFKAPTCTAISGRAIGTSQYRRNRGQAGRASDAHSSHRQVSILTRPYDRVQQSHKHRVYSRIVFQSSPGLTTGCNAGSAASLRSVSAVSILTRPYDRVQLAHAGRCRRLLEVSILTRPYDRVQRTERFQPTGRRRVSILTRPYDRVQLDVLAEDVLAVGVSILTRPYDRVQRDHRRHPL